MPVLDTGHLLAFPHDVLDTGEGGKERREEGGRARGGRELQAGIKGEL